MAGVAVEEAEAGAWAVVMVLIPEENVSSTDTAAATDRKYFSVVFVT